MRRPVALRDHTHRPDPGELGLDRAVLRRRAESSPLDQRREPVKIEKDYRGRLLQESAHPGRERALAENRLLRRPDLAHACGAELGPEMIDDARESRRASA